MITNQDLLEIGFKPMQHFTVGNSHIFDLGRNRQLSVGNAGTPNEMLFITETSSNHPITVTDAIIIHNYDYDGYITIEKIKGLIDLIANKIK